MLDQEDMQCRWQFSLHASCHDRIGVVLDASRKHMISSLTTHRCMPAQILAAQPVFLCLSDRGRRRHPAAAAQLGLCQSVDVCAVSTVLLPKVCRLLLSGENCVVPHLECLAIVLAYLRPAAGVVPETGRRRRLTNASSGVGRLRRLLWNAWCNDVSVHPVTAASQTLWEALSH